MTEVAGPKEVDKTVIMTEIAGQTSATSGESTCADLARNANTNMLDLAVACRHVTAQTLQHHHQHLQHLERSWWGVMSGTLLCVTIAADLTT